MTKKSSDRFLLLLRQSRIDIDLSGLDRVTVIAPENSLSFIEFLRFFRLAVIEMAPDIVHSWEGVVTTAAVLVRSTLRRSFTIIAGSLRYSRRYRFFSKTALISRFNAIFSDAVIANSRSALAAAGFSPGGKFHVLPNGFDLNQFLLPRNGRNSLKPFRIGMVANFTEPKDYSTLAAAAVELIRKGIDLTVECVGDGPERAAAEHSVPADLRGRIVFFGVLRNEDVLKRINEWDVGVLLSKKGHSEGMSNAIMEYMLLGKPVICTNTGGNPELIEDGVNGFLIPHEDRFQLVERLKWLLSDTEVLRKMGDHSRRVAWMNFGIDRVSTQLLSLYDQLRNR
ncbi:MAG: glycosyltransferase family 1 protein [Desulfobacteraceae bacterium]|nr:MAG: glycosyltransferase family 1 protein [Desulfobacteraceae bacterium]